MPMKKSIGTIGNRTRDLPACSAVPQPTAPPRAPRSTHTHARARVKPNRRHDFPLKQTVRINFYLIQNTKHTKIYKYACTFSDISVLCLNK